jgi:nitrogenase molybdenum-iron protein beta chain
MSLQLIEKPRVSCALGGALATVNALPRTAPILHASMGCGNMTGVSMQGASGYLGSSYCGGNSTPATGLGESEVVFGGEQRLEEQLRATAEIVDADLYAVITGCTAELIGDDARAVVRRYNQTRREKAPAILISGAGFKGDSLWGYDATLESLFRDYVRSEARRRAGVVNLLGVPPAQDVWWHGNLVELRRILSGLGLQVNTLFLPDDSLERIARSASARASVVVSPTHGVKAARALQEVHGTPYFTTDLPIGAKATRAFVQQVAAELELDSRLVSDFLQREERRYYHVFNRIADAYADIDLQRHVVVIGTIDYALALSRFVSQELGWLPELVVVTDQVDERAKQELTGRFSFLESAASQVVFETDGSQIARRFAERWPGPSSGRYRRTFSPAFVLGSRLDRDWAESIGAGHLSVSYPVSNRVVLGRGYAGYDGALSLTEDILSVILASR